MVLATTYSRTTYRCTTIGERSFHFRVRYGNGWGQASKVTRVLRTAVVGFAQWAQLTVSNVSGVEIGFKERGVL
jgi:hypothetical protein